MLSFDELFCKINKLFGDYFYRFLVMELEYY